MTGGKQPSSPHQAMDSTEIFVDGSESWSIVGKLPHAFYDLRAISVNNNVLITGWAKVT